MKAMQLPRFGGPEVFELIDLPAREPGRGEVRVSVAAAGVNFAETLMRENRYAMTPALPSVLGCEAVGVIDAIGPDASGFAVGQRVAAALFAAGIYAGGYASQITLAADCVVPIPDELPFDAAVALMVQGLTAWHLVRQAPPAGKTVLINAAAGGVGSLLVPLCRRAGAKTILAAASTAEKRALATSLGADIGVDYTRPDWERDLIAASGGAEPDIIYESVGGDVTSASLRALAPLGQMVVYGALNIQQFQLGVPELLGMIFKNQSLSGFAFAPLLTTENLQRALGELFGLAAAGDLTVTIGGRYPLERVGDAHRALEQRRSSGKLILVP